jgi:hypothetical protein
MTLHSTRLLLWCFLALGASATLLACSPRSSEANHVVELLIKAKGFLKKLTVLGSYYDQGAIVVVYRDEGDLTGVWNRYRCYPPAGSSRWYCEKLEPSAAALFLDE